MKSALNDFPTELWVRCWSQSSFPDLCSLALVSRHFRELCQPLVFQRQFLQTPSAEGSQSLRDRKEYSRHLKQSTARLEALVASPHLTAVKSWVFSGDRRPAITWVNEAQEAAARKASAPILRLFTKTLVKCENVRSLTLCFTSIDKPMKTAILGLKHLQSLELKSCDLSLWKKPDLRVEELTLGQSPGMMWETPVGALHIVVPEPLRALTVNDPGIALSLLTGFAERGSDPLTNLTILSLQLNALLVPKLAAFLARCPQLHTLEISKTAELTRTPPEALPATTIPLLRIFKSPRFLATYFVAGRPLVRELELLDNVGVRPQPPAAPRDIIADLAAIAEACPALTALTINTPIAESLRVTRAVAAHWAPALRSLAIVLRKSAGERDILDDSDSSDDGVDLGAWGESGDDDSDSNGSGVDRPDWDWAGDPYAADIIALSGGMALPAGLEALRKELEAPLGVAVDDDDEADAVPLEPRRRRRSPAPTPTAVQTPEVLAAGYMYTSEGVFPPPKPSSLPTAAPTSLPTLIDALCTSTSPSRGPTVTFPALTTLSFTRPTFLRSLMPAPPLPLPAQHRAVLALERVLPALFVQLATLWMVPGAASARVSRRRREGAELRAERRGTACDEEEDDCNNHTANNKSQSSASPQSSNPPFQSGAQQQQQQDSSQMHSTVVALACVLSFILVAIIVFLIWRTIVRTRQRKHAGGPLPYIEISDADADARPVSFQQHFHPDRSSSNRALPIVMEPEPERETMPPPVQPFLQTQRRMPTRIYRAFADLEEKYRQRVVRSEIEEEDPDVNTPPPGYRSTETIPLR
ncbi:hypothetical protein C8R46DRAFT_1344250 [Mycena filopes]|nr:hypothetical protein C8R46DRAFT_1344250 [Mycena filopes]